MKILLLSPNQIHRYNWTHQLFRNEIGRQHNVIYYGDGYPNYNPDLEVSDIIKEVSEPDLILTYGYKYTKPFKGLGKIKNISKAHIVIDYFKSKGDFKATYDQQNIFFKENKYDIIFAVTSESVDLLKENNFSPYILLLPFSIDTNIYKNLNFEKSIDVSAVYTKRDDVYPNRGKVQKILEKNKSLKTFTKRVSNYKFVDVINKSKIFITSNNIYGSLSIKYYEVLACGTLLLADRPVDLEIIGFKDKKHLVIYNDLDDLRNKLKYYLENKKEREEISKNGFDFVRENHSCEIRVKQFTNYINNLIGVK